MWIAIGRSVELLFKSLGYDPVKDFVPVTKIAIAPLLVLVRAD